MILTLTGASGAGKTTIAERLIGTLPNARFLTSFTTRAARPSDLPGEYAYLSDAEFDRMRDDGEFLWTAQVADTRHGTSKATLQRALDDEGTISIMILVPEVMRKLYDFVEVQKPAPSEAEGVQRSRSPEAEGSRGPEVEKTGLCSYSDSSGGRPARPDARAGRRGGEDRSANQRDARL